MAAAEKSGLFLFFFFVLNLIGVLLILIRAVTRSAAGDYIVFKIDSDSDFEVIRLNQSVRTPTGRAARLTERERNGRHGQENKI